MSDRIIERAMEFAERTFRDDYSGHDFDHTLRVFKTASRLARAEGADIMTVQLAALLHDVDDAKLSPKTCENKDKARGFLSENNVSEELADRICAIIGEISFRGTGGVTPSTIEGMCVQDADRLDASREAYMREFVQRFLDEWDGRDA